jgi:hypothetical protein
VKSSRSGGAYLRQEVLYSSQITEWRKLRDAGVLAGKSAGAKVGRPTAEQAEIARLRRQLDVAERRYTRAGWANRRGHDHAVTWPRPGAVTGHGLYRAAGGRRTRPYIHFTTNVVVPTLPFVLDRSVLPWAAQGHAVNKADPT